MATKAKAALVALIKSGADGGHGEFEKFLPKRLSALVQKHDHTYMPTLTKSGAVVWVRVQ